MKYHLARFLQTLIKLFWEVLRLFILLVPVSLPWLVLTLILNENPDIYLPYHVPAALPLCLLALYSSYFLGHLLWPIMMIILFPISRLRDPKFIIRLGERFRKLNLSAPQIFVIKNSALHFINKWPLIGYFILPKPFGASIFMTQKVFDPLIFSHFDLVISQYAVKAKFHRWSSSFFTFTSVGIVFYTFLYTLHHHFESQLQINFGIPAAKHLAFFVVSLCFAGAIAYITYRSRKAESEYELTQLLAEDTLHESPTVASVDRPKKAILIVRAYSYSLLLLLTLTILTLGLNEHIQKQVTSLKVPKIEIELPTLHPAPKKNLFTEAIERRNHRQIMLLIGQGQDYLPEQTLDNAPPLLVATKYGDLKTVYLLLLAGHSIDQVDEQGRNIYFYALEAPDRVRVLKYLLLTKANRHHRDKKQMTALDLAREKKYPDAESILLSQPESESKPVESIDQASKSPASTTESTK